MRRKSQLAENTTYPEANFTIAIEIFNGYIRKDIVNRVMSMSMTQSKGINAADWKLFKSIMNRKHPGLIPDITSGQFQKMKVAEWEKIRAKYRSAITDKR